jgi:single-stranded-DNA-specific exonuclease
MSRLRRWRLAPQHEGGAALAAALGVSPLIGQLLANRGIGDAEVATTFLGSRLDQHLRSPMLFRDMARASERLVDALGRGERIGIYGDYDVDGVSGSALLVRFLRSVGANPEPVVHIPHRLKEGYGLGATGIERLAAAGARVMITVGSWRRRPPGDRARQRAGMDVIVCDATRWRRRGRRRWR